MGLDELLELTSSVAWKLLPILGAAVLIYLIILLKRVIKVIENSDKAVITADDTMKTLNRQMQSLDKPLSTLNDLSDTVDYVHEASKSAVKSTVAVVIDNFANIKEWTSAKLNEKKEFSSEDE